jgi:hypothetical protein
MIGGRSNDAMFCGGVLPDPVKVEDGLGEDRAAAETAAKSSRRA